jgi:hypothetical protein
VKVTKSKKAAGKKHKAIKRGKSLEAVKPLSKFEVPVATALQPLVGVKPPSFSTSNAGTGPTDTLSLNFTKIEIEYKPQD